LNTPRHNKMTARGLRLKEVYDLEALNYLPPLNPPFCLMILFSFPVHK
jgi:hypothetical protein